MDNGKEYISVFKYKGRKEYKNKGKGEKRSKKVRM
jgi:hypothetical protein